MAQTKSLHPRVQSRLSNEELYRLTPGVLDLYDAFDDESGIKFAQLIYKFFTKEFELKDFPDILVKNLDVDLAVAIGIAYEYSIRVFSDLDDYFSEIPMLLAHWEVRREKPYAKPNRDIVKWDKGEFHDADGNVPSMKKDFLTDIDVEEDDEFSQYVEERLEKEGFSASRGPKRSTENIVKNAPTLQELLQQPADDQSQNIRYLRIREALRLNPRIGEGLLTGNAMQMKGHNNLQRPSIRNWIKDYELNKGRKRHTARQRTNYLKNALNAKELDDEDKIKVGLVLKSYDEDLKISFNDKWEIVFEAKKEEVEEGKKDSLEEDVEKILEEKESRKKKQKKDKEIIEEEEKDDHSDEEDNELGLSSSISTNQFPELDLKGNRFKKGKEQVKKGQGVGLATDINKNVGDDLMTQDELHGIFGENDDMDDMINNE